MSLARHQRQVACAKLASFASGLVAVCISHFIDHRYFHALDGGELVQDQQPSLAIVARCHVGPHDGT